MNEQFIQQNFVTPEIAKALRELWFNEPCLGVFDPSDRFISYSIDQPAFNDETGWCAAPLWQQAIQWLRGKGIQIICEFTFNVDDSPVYAVRSVLFGGDADHLPITEAISEALSILKQQSN